MPKSLPIAPEIILKGMPPAFRKAGRAPFRRSNLKTQGSRSNSIFYDFQFLDVPSLTSGTSSGGASSGTHFMPCSSCTQMKYRLLAKDSRTMLLTASSTVLVRQARELYVSRNCRQTPLGRFWRAETIRQVRAGQGMYYQCRKF